MLDQPGRRFDLSRIEPEPGPELAGNDGAGFRMILGPSFGDVVQEHGHIQGAAVADGSEDAVRQRMLARQAPGRYSMADVLGL